MSADKLRQEDLRRELVRLREKGITQADELDNARQPKVPLPLLDEAAEMIVGPRAGLTRSGVIAVLLRSAIGKLVDPGYREWLPVSLGVKEGLKTVDPEALNRVAADLAGHVAPNDFKRTGGKLQRAFDVLAAQIIADCSYDGKIVGNTDELVALPERAAEELDSNLVDRDEYIDQINRLASAHRVVYIWGEGGTGKSTLANVAAIGLAKGAPIAVLHAADDEALRDDIVHLLIAEGLEPDSWTDSFCRAQLQRILIGAPNTAVVIVDDVETEDKLWRVIPKSPSLYVVVTSRARPHSERVASLELGDFTEAQAKQLVERQLPEASALEVETLTILLGQRPLALMLASRYVAATHGVQLARMLTALAEQTAPTVDNISLASPQHVNLVRLYQLIVQAVLAEVAAREALDVFLALAGKSGMFDWDALLLFVDWRSSEDSGRRIAFTSGVHVLMNYGLLREAAGNNLAMHPLTWSILRDLRGAVLFPIEDEYLGFLADEGLSDRVGAISPSVRLMQRQLFFGTNLWEEWRYFHIIDSRTSVVVLEDRDEYGVTKTRTIRYYLIPTGVYRHNYDTGKMERVEDAEEARRFYFGMLRYHVAARINLLSLDAFGGEPSKDYAIGVFAESDDLSLMVESLEDDPHRLGHLVVADLAHSLAEQLQTVSYSAFDLVTKATYQELVDGTKILGLPELQQFVGWFIDDGHASWALAILDRFVEASGDLSSRAAAELAILRARAYLVLGDWIAADTWIVRSLGLFRQPEHSLAISLHGMIRGHSLNIDLLLMRGSNPRELHEAFAVLRSLWESRPDGFEGQSSTSRFHRVRGRVNAALASYYVDEALQADRTEVSPAPFEAALHNLTLALDGGRGTIRSRVEREEIRYDFMLVKSVKASRIDVDAVLREADTLVPHSFDISVVNTNGQTDRPSWRDQQTSFRLTLLACKLEILIGIRERHRWYYRSLEKRSEFIARFESAYWYGEYLAVLCILATRLGYPSAGLRVAARQHFVDFDRLDRWNRLRDTLETSDVDMSRSERWKLNFWLLTW